MFGIFPVDPIKNARICAKVIHDSSQKAASRSNSIAEKLNSNSFLQFGKNGLWAVHDADPDHDLSTGGGGHGGQADVL